MNAGREKTEWFDYDGGWKVVQSEVIQESRLTIYVNGQELVSLMATPLEGEELALGFLRNERLIAGLDEVKEVTTREEGCCIDVWLNRSFAKPDHEFITSGCGGGVTYTDEYIDVDALQDTLRMDPEKLRVAFTSLQQPDSLYVQAGGVHGAALFDGDEVLAVVEDIGRHNTIDKLLGRCMRQDISTQGRALLATGRISSEMLVKGARMGCPILASRSSPTSLSLNLAEKWHITLAGYVRGSSMRVYTHPERLGYLESEEMKAKANG
ncbi:MAG: formate dehydrogenase accessory sulfurtransferase FdhD [Anaerolineales bacterium]